MITTEEILLGQQEHTYMNVKQVETWYVQGTCLTLKNISVTKTLLSSFSLTFAPPCVCRESNKQLNRNGLWELFSSCLNHIVRTDSFLESVY